MSVDLSKLHTPVPDNELFKIRFPEFVNVQDALIDMILDEMSDHVDDRWRDKDYQPAIMYLTAHRLTLEGEPARSNAATAAAGGSVAAAATGAIKRVKVDDTETEFFEGGTTNAVISSTSLSGLEGDVLDYTLTPYGRRFMQLRARNHGGPRVFCP